MFGSSSFRQLPDGWIWVVSYPEMTYSVPKTPGYSHHLLIAKSRASNSLRVKFWHRRNSATVWELVRILNYSAFALPFMDTDFFDCNGHIYVSPSKISYLIFLSQAQVEKNFKKLPNLDLRMANGVKIHPLPFCKLFQFQVTHIILKCILWAGFLSFCSRHLLLRQTLFIDSGKKEALQKHSSSGLY